MPRRRHGASCAVASASTWLSALPAGAGRKMGVNGCSRSRAWTFVAQVTGAIRFQKTAKLAKIFILNSQSRILCVVCRSRDPIPKKHFCEGNKYYKWAKKVPLYLITTSESRSINQVSLSMGAAESRPGETHPFCLSLCSGGKATRWRRGTGAHLPRDERPQISALGRLPAARQLRRSLFCATRCGPCEQAKMTHTHLSARSGS